MRIGPTWDTASRKITRTKRYNEESWQAGRHTPNTEVSSKATLHLPEERHVQLLCAASYGIWCTDLDTDQTSTLAVAQTNMECSTSQGRKTNIWGKEKTKAIYIYI